MRKRAPPAALAVAAALAPLLWLTGCDTGMGPMVTGGAPMPTRFSGNGERIYFTGTSASGRPIAFAGASMHLQIRGGGCASCHGADREGRAR